MNVSPALLPPIATFLPGKRTLPPIKDWPEDDRPREKLISKGAIQLSHAELLAILINSGNSTQSAVELAQSILRHCRNDLTELSRLDPKSLMQFPGIGPKKAVTILAALELSRRKQISPLFTKIRINTTAAAAAIMKPLLSDQPCESFYVLFLNHANKLLHHACISTGGITSTTVDPRIVFNLALQHKATRLLLCHNHPSGLLKASAADIAVTRKLKEGGKLLDIDILDHMIVSEEGYFSLRDEGFI